MRGNADPVPPVVQDLASLESNPVRPVIHSYEFQVSLPPPPPRRRPPFSPKRPSGCRTMPGPAAYYSIWSLFSLSLPIRGGCLFPSFPSGSRTVLFLFPFPSDRSFPPPLSALRLCAAPARSSRPQQSGRGKSDCETTRWRMFWARTLSRADAAGTASSSRQRAPTIPSTGRSTESAVSRSLPVPRRRDGTLETQYVTYTHKKNDNNGIQSRPRSSFSLLVVFSQPMLCRGINLFLLI